MKCLPYLFAALLPMLFAPARAAVIYSSLKDIVIPTDFVGIYLDLDTGTTGIDDSSPLTGWDINPFFGGMDVANSPAFQPARTGTGTTDTVLRLSVGATINAAVELCASRLHI